MTTYTIEYTVDQEWFSMSGLTTDQVPAIIRSIEENGGDVHDIMAERNLPIDEGRLEIERTRIVARGQSPV